MTRLAAPALACGAILLALLWARGDIPWIPVLSETTGLAAILFFTGLSAEPALRGRGWTLVERFGLSAAISAASAVLAGLGLHLARSPVTTTNVLTILLVVSVVLGILSLPYRRRTARFPLAGIRRVEVAVGLLSLVLLAGSFGAILVVRPAPDQPPLEAALVDDAGTLLVLPFHVRPNTPVHLNVALRSPSGLTSQTSVSITGGGLQPWSAGGIVLTGAWEIVPVSLLSLRSGTIDAVVEIHGDRSDLRLPVQIEVGP